MKVVSTMRARGLRRAEHPRTVQQHNGLAGPRPAGESERAGVGRLGVPALLGMQEGPPLSEVAALDDAAQLLVVLEPRELHPRGGRLETASSFSSSSAPSSTEGGSSRPRVRADLLDRLAGREIEQRQALPLDR